MTEEINYKNNPLNGVGLKALVTELVDHYGFEILYAYLNINCFKTNPSVASSVKFLKNTTWAREKVEAFYLYQFKRMPQAPSDQLHIPPRDRIIPDDQKPGEPAELSLEDAEQLHEKRAKRAADYDKSGGHRYKHNKGSGAPRGQYSNRKDNQRPDSSRSSKSSAKNSNDPWGQWKNKSED
ncbi:MAG TPA: VF530 family DNA-binding protein [Kangiella sp.]|uniref:VF530 family protein n=1 Tax=Kangiella sp. TaxID=1920245 RepID=UPI002F92441D